jgi:hypothetical protein
MGGALLIGAALLLVWLVTGQPPAQALQIPPDAIERAAAILLLGGWIERRARRTPPELVRAARKLRWRAPRQLLLDLAAPGVDGFLARLLGALIAALSLAPVGVGAALLGLDDDLRAVIGSLGVYFRWLILLYIFVLSTLAWALRKAGWLWVGRWDWRARGLLARDAEGRALLREAAATLPGARAQEAEALAAARAARGA